MPADLTAKPEDERMRRPFVERLAWLLDDSIRIPGTNRRIGLDGLVGLLLPVYGDVITALASAVIVFSGVRQRLPPVVILRMLVNLAVDAIVGMLPFAGDLFDFAFKANRRNIALLKQHTRGTIRTARPADYLVVGLALIVVVAVVALPILLTAYLLSSLVGLFR
jgi:hypothetical protein